MNRYLKQWLLGGGLILASPYALAADDTPWISYLLIMMGVALVAGIALTYRNKKVEALVPRLLLIGLYFWVFTFAQVTVLAIIYYFTK
ncbi:hypothetical protein [Aliikangiella maris]|uniref:Uncharacterized protein n=2 Tax=Aliikangiella maris TaxID=3162458 RepID=A0ABV2BSL5_9GAMM